MSVQLRLRVAAEAYAMPVEHVLEVIGLGQVTAVPRSPPALLGVRNLRGQILAVIDLALLFGIPRTVPPSSLVVAEAGGRRAGFAVDEVTWIGQMGDPTEETDSDLLAGAAFGGGALIGMIDVPRLFDSLAQAQQ